MRAVVAAVLIGCGVLGLVPRRVEAQESTVRFYIVPKATDANNRTRPKYVFAMGLPYTAMDYGLEDTYLVACEPDAAQHTTLAANIDVIAIPAPIDDAIGLTALTTVQNRLEGMHVPAGWVTQNTTYRQVVGLLGKLFVFMQRFHGLNLRTFFEAGITLDTRINQLTQAQRNALIDAATDLGLETSAISGSTTIRAALKIVADQLPGFTLRGEVFP